MTTTFCRTLLDRTAQPYRRENFARHVATGKSRCAPVFFDLLEHGPIRKAERPIDVGRIRGLLASWGREARALHESGSCSVHWPAARKVENIRKSELLQEDVARARTILGERGEFARRDIRSTDFGKADVAIILNVLHYISHEGRIRGALQ